MFNQMQLTILRIVMENFLEDFRKEKLLDNTNNMDMEYGNYN